MPNTHRPPIKRRHSAGVDKEAEKRNNRRLIQLMVCLVILGGVLIIRIFQPKAVQAFVFERIQGGFEMEEALSYIGETFKNIFIQVPAPDEQGSEPSPSSSPEPSALPSDEPEEDGAGDKDNADPQASPSPLMQVQPEILAMGGFDEPLTLPEEYLPPSDEDDEDDTLPLPFGVEKPEKADYTVYELPFETTLPLKGEVTSPFGYRIHPIDGVLGFHYGLDIAAVTGTDIVSYAGGTVIATGNSNSYGLYLMVRHDSEYITLYAHCSKITVKEGQSVKMGQKIAKVGSTGKATGPHLHFEIRKGSSLLNPAYYLELES